MYRRLILILLFSVNSLSAGTPDTRKPVFIHAACDSNISAGVLSSLIKGVQASQKYRLVRSLDDDGRMGIVLTIYMDCAERNSIIAVATNYGLSKCYGEKNCHLSVDGRSIKSTICDGVAPTECGRTLLRNLDDYLKTPNPSTFKLN